MLKKTPQEIVGVSINDFYPSELAAKYRVDDQRVIEKGESISQEERYILPNGEAIWIYMIKTPIRDNSGKIIGLQGIFWDITQRKQMEEKLIASEIKYRQFIEFLQVGIWAIDLNALTTFVNPYMAETLGYAPEEMLGKHVLFLWMIAINREPLIR